MARLTTLGAAAFTLAATLVSGSTIEAAAGSRDGFVTVISTRTDQVLASVRVGESPGQIVTTVDGRIAYVANIASYSVDQVKVGVRVTARRLRIGALPVGLAITPDGKTVYVARYSGNGGPGSVLPVRALTGVAERPIMPSPQGGEISSLIAVTPNGRRVLAAEFLAGPG